MDHEKGGHHDIEAHHPNARETLAKEVYGSIIDVDASTGDIQQLCANKSTSWNLRLRQWIANVGAKEGGIERVPPELRTDQPSRDIFTLFMSKLSFNFSIPSVVSFPLGYLKLITIRCQCRNGYACFWNSRPFIVLFGMVG